MIRWFCLYTHEYLPWVARFNESATKCGFDRFVELVDYDKRKRSDWMDNCLFRPQFILGQWTDNGVGLLDSDLYIHAFPQLLTAEAPDLNVITHHRPNERDASRYCAGITGFVGKRGKETLEEWAKLCKEDPTPGRKLREQLYLYWAIEKIRPEVLDVGPLYNWVAPIGKEVDPPEDVVIIHGDLRGPAHRSRPCAPLTQPEKFQWDLPSLSNQ